MNNFLIMGRLTKDPEVRYGGANNTCIARFSIAVDRRFKRDGEPEADFFTVTAFGKTGEFVEKFLKKGIKIIVSGEMHNNNYTDKNGYQVYGNEVIASAIEFCESKAKPGQDLNEGFMNIGDSAEDELPFR